ncbi:MAG: putative nucleic-acid-binding Zn-ribbon protein [Clostridium sp.]|jgi:predicted nucleic-acid-binding Zn-ribbon protein
MEHICPKCSILMIEANLDHNGLLRLYKKTDKKVGFFGLKENELTNINQSVCPKCGYVEFYAEEPQKLC